MAEIKYKSNPDFGFWIGCYLTKTLLRSGFFDGIDRIVPVPLHPIKQWQRGFNQAERIAAGISHVSGIPLEIDLLQRVRANSTQTKKGLYDRWINTKEIFSITNPQQWEQSHILLVDDVLTTGSTLESASQTLSKIVDLKLSILTLAIA